MDDFFSNLARQVLGSQPELGPLLPPRFAAWPDLSLASPPAQAPEPVDQPATAEAALFPPPLIAPGHPGSDTPLPTFRQLSQVGTGPGPSIQPDLPPIPEHAPETTDAEPGDMGQDVAPPFVPAADGSRPEPTMAMPPIDVGQTRPTLPAPPAQPVVQEQAGGATDVAPGQAIQPADAPVTPLVPAPALEPAVAPEPAPVLQQASPAQGHQAPATSPLQPASHTQPGYSSPGQASPPADAPVTPLVPAPALEPPVVPEPAPALQPAGPAQGHQAPATSPLQPASHTQPGDLVPSGYSSPGQASPPTDTPFTPLVPAPALEPAASPEPAPVLQRQGTPEAKISVPPSPVAGHGTPLPAEAAASGRPPAPEVTIASLQPAAPAGDHPPRHRLREALADRTGFSTPSEPGIVPAPEAPLADGWPLTAARPAWSRPRPALPPPPEPPPTVRVTIGRVEVRMAPPEPPPPVQPRQPPRLALSLDEYLKGGEP